MTVVDKKFGGWRHARHAHGLTLIELMVAMVLGLIVIAGVASVFLANMRSYRTNAALGDVQSSARIAFELMTRDIRDAGSTGCNSANDRVRNVLANQATDWWANWNNAVRGYADAAEDPALSSETGAGAPVAGSDSLEIVSAGANPAGTVALYDGTNASFTLAAPVGDIGAGDVVMICSPGHAAIVQLDKVTAGAGATANTSTASFIVGGTPGNTSVDLGYPAGSCAQHGAATVLQYCFPANSLVSRLRAATWYIGTNPLGGHSLYRMTLETQGGKPTTTAQEMVRGVATLEITYHQAGDPTLAGDFFTADKVNQWNHVDAVRMTLTLQSSDGRASTDATPISRSFTTTTTLRNRVH